MNPDSSGWLLHSDFVGSKAKGRTSKRWLQENKARQIYRKTTLFYSLLRARTFVYLEVRNTSLFEIWRALISCNNCFEICSFALLPIVSNMARKEISKLMLQENKPRQIFRKTNISYPG